MDRLQCHWFERQWRWLLEGRRPAAVRPRPGLVELVSVGCVCGPETTHVGRYLGWALRIPEWKVPASGCGRFGSRRYSGDPSRPRWPIVGGYPWWTGPLG